MTTANYSPYGVEITGEALQAAGKYRVQLATVGNPDFGQRPDRALPGAERKHWKSVTTLAEASSVCRDFIERNEMGAGNWAGGDVLDANNKVVARVSYNGRVWAAVPVEGKAVAK